MDTAISSARKKKPTDEELANLAVIDAVLCANALYAADLNKFLNPTQEDLCRYAEKAMEHLDRFIVKKNDEDILEELVECISAVNVTDAYGVGLWYPSAASAAREMLAYLPKEVMKNRGTAEAARAACVDWQGDMMKNHFATTEIAGMKYFMNWERAVERLNPDAPKEKDELVGAGVSFQRIRRITGYLVGDVSRFNDAKQHEEHDRVKHTADDSELPIFKM